MDVPFELHIALRYLLAKRKQAFISVISLISTLGVTVGVMALIIALALMTGLQGELRNRILGSNAHVYVWKQGGIVDYHAEARKLLQVPHVVGAAPALTGLGLISASSLASPVRSVSVSTSSTPPTGSSRSTRPGGFSTKTSSISSSSASTTSTALLRSPATFPIDSATSTRRTTGRS